MPSGSKIVMWDALRQGRLAHAVTFPEINRGYLHACFGFRGVVDLKWMVGEEGGHSRPLTIHHGPVFDSPNACSWAASSIIHGYRRPGRSRAFYFSQVNNSSPLTQPWESRNRGRDKQGSRWLVEPVRTSTLFWFGSQRGSLHAHGPAASHREPERDSVTQRTQASWTVNIILRTELQVLLRPKLGIHSTETTECLITV